MRKTLSLILVLIISFLIHETFVLGLERKGPEMIIQEPDFDFGKVHEGVLLEHTFLILNRGDDILKIVGVEPE